MTPSIQRRINLLEVRGAALGADAMTADAAQALTRLILTLHTVLRAPAARITPVIQSIAGTYPENLFALDERLESNRATLEDRIALAELNADDLRAAKLTAETLVRLMVRVRSDF